ncbi:MAG: type II toxin-antitoxin system HicB family antitoxin [Candidatus Diapherotrites archaeon]|nr:type II toxin-antitoxin system HicB family antitoxin [Candidatus Diapherotrites archaeon]
MEMQFDVIVIQDSSGGFIGFVPELPGCHTQGDTLDELMENIKEAAELYIETLSKEEKEELLKHKTEFMGMQKVKVNA